MMIKELCIQLSDYILIKRSKSKTWSNANLSFINYKMSGKMEEIEIGFQWKLFSRCLC